MKKMFSLLSVFCLIFSLSVTVFAVDVNKADVSELLSNGAYRRYIQDTFDIYDVSRKNNVDPDDLTDAVIKGMNSDKFSPFSEIQTLDQKNAAVVNNEEAVSPQSEHIIENQDSTAYLATGNAGASGTMPWVGSCAVHRANSNSTRPLIPFGTTVYYLNKTVTIEGNTYSSFVVNDTGDANFNRSIYWTDLYFGDKTSENYTAAMNYGVQRDIRLYFIR